MGDAQVPLTDVRIRIADLVRRAEHGGERIVLTRHGRPAAVLVSVADYDQLRAADMDIAATSPLVISETVTIDEIVEPVWDAVLSAIRRKRWWPSLYLEDLPGGMLEERRGEGSWARGEILERVQDQLLVISWREDGWAAPTNVRLELVETKTERGGPTLVRVTHTGWELLPDGLRLAERQRKEWRAHLDALRGYVTPEREQSPEDG